MSNMTGNDTVPEIYQMTLEDHIYIILITYIAPALFTLFILVGVPGNALVLFVILSRPNMRTPTNLLLLNLALADIAFLIFCLPFNVYRYVAPTWSIGEMACKCVQYLVYVSAYVTVYTLVSISVLRFFIVVRSTTTATMNTHRHVMVTIAAIWILIILGNIPTFQIHQVKTLNNYSYCGHKTSATAPMFLTFFLMAYAIPLVTISLLYLMILCHLRQHQASCIVQKSSQKRTTRAYRVIALVIVVFGLLWLPNQAIFLTSAFGKRPQTMWFEIVRILAMCLGNGNSCINPLIYNFFSQDFQKAFRETICQGRNDKRRNRPSDRCNQTETLTIV